MHLALTENTLYQLFIERMVVQRNVLSSYHGLWRNAFVPQTCNRAKETAVKYFSQGHRITVSIWRVHVCVDRAFKPRSGYVVVFSDKSAPQLSLP